MILDKHNAELVYRTCRTFVTHQARYSNTAPAVLSFGFDAAGVFYRPSSDSRTRLLVVGRDGDEKYEGIAAFREAYGLEEAKD